MLHGNRTFILQDENGQITETHSISAGLDYPGVGPEHAWLQEIKRAQYVGITDKEAPMPSTSVPHRGHHSRARIEPRFAYAMKLSKGDAADQSILVNLSGRATRTSAPWPTLGRGFHDRPSMRGHKVKGGDKP